MENGYTDLSIDLQYIDSVFHYSAGYLDLFGGEYGKKFMKRRCKDLLIEIGHLPINEQHKIIEKRYIEWIGDLNQVDDILIIGVKI
jgi:hypothetical protein